MLHTENLVAGYGRRGVVRLKHLEIAPGKVTVLIGPNASGKSTLVRTLAQALKPQQGRVLLHDRDLYRLPARDAARCIAYVPQASLIPFAFTVAELVGLGAASSGDAGKKVRDALHLLDLTPLAGRSLTTLSGGEQQRALVARAFAQDTPVLLLDEPTAHLDPRHQMVLMQAVRSATRDANKAVLIVLHDLNLAAQWGDFFVLMSGGEILGQGTASDVLTEPLLSQAYQTPVIVQNGLRIGPSLMRG